MNTGLQPYKESQSMEDLLRKMALTAQILSDTLNNIRESRLVHAENDITVMTMLLSTLEARLKELKNCLSWDGNLESSPKR